MSVVAAWEIAAALAAFGLIALAGEVLYRRGAVQAEVTRAVEHIADGGLSAILPTFLSFPQISAVFALLTGLAWISKSFNVFRGIHEVSRKTWGEILFPIGLLVVAVFGPRPAVFVYSSLVVGVADGLAALVGHRFGRRASPRSRWRKTSIGSATFFVSCLAIGSASFAAQGLSLAASVVGATILAALLTLVEATLSNGFDDLVLPLVAGLGMVVAVHISG
jgi:phytol kinase